MRREGEPNVHLTEADTALARARVEARQTLDSLLAYVRAAGTTRGAAYIKTPLRTAAGGLEHIWLEVLTADSTWIRGQVDNNPLDPTVARLGDTLVVPVAAVTDWMYSDSTGDHGGYTVRLLQEREEAESLRTARGPSATSTAP